MDVQRGVLAAIFALSIVGCAPGKTLTAVFPDSKKDKSDNVPGSCSSLSRIENQFIVQWEDGTISYEMADGKDVFINGFVKPNLQNIRRVEFDALIPASQQYSSPAQSFGDEDDSTEQWGLMAISAEQGWALGADGAGVVVAVIDSGVDTFHVQLRDRIAINHGEIPGNGIDDDENGYVDDYAGYDFYNDSGEIYDVLGHGTHVAGVIAADHFTGPIRGVAPKAKILPLNFMSGPQGGTLSAAIRSIEYAAKRKVDIINASWGTQSCSEILSGAIKELDKQGILFVTAAGNSGSSLDSYPEYPAAFGLPNQITVGASTRRDLTAFFSNFSPRLVHLMAPGNNIYSTIPGDAYASLQGTSMAAPFVAGTAALLKGLYPKAQPRHIKEAISNSVDRGSFSSSSGGRLNTAAAIRYLQENYMN